MAAYDYAELPPTWQAIADWLTRHRPAEGWAAPFVMLLTVGSAAGALVDANWVRGLNHLVATALLAALLAAVLAKLPTPAWRAWLILAGYGGSVALLQTGRLLPPTDVWWQGAPAVQTAMRTRAALLADRLVGWYRTLQAGGSSQDTTAFVLGLTLIAWFGAAYVAWATLRRRRPLPALLTLALIVAANGYFKNEISIWLLAFNTSLILLLALVRLAEVERRWQQTHVDYSPEIRIDIIATAAGLAIFLPLLAYSVPSLSPTRIARAFARAQAVRQGEQALERAFGGVAGARTVAAPVNRGILPRSHLIGNAPALRETVVLTATVQRASGAPRNAPPANWQSISYDIYTGRGWLRSSERSQPLAAGASLPLPALAATQTVSQTVYWQIDARTTRYTLGTPRTFDAPVVTYWRGADDYVRAEGNGRPYTLQSRVSLALPDQLRAAARDGLPAAIVERYTTIERAVPARVTALATEITAAAPTAYDQARAIELFLHQYPYTLDLPAPPADRDLVDYFLFDLQRGYCDYYATAMVVLARAVGLPARVQIGFLAQPTDVRGVQTVRAIDAHAWPEIYFSGYGWIPFEPTPGVQSAAPGALPTTADDEVITPPPLPTRRPIVRWPLWLTALLAAALLTASAELGLALAHRRRAEQALLGRYGQLVQHAAALGMPVSAAWTPAELRQRLDAYLDTLPQRRWLAQRPALQQRLAGWVALTAAEINTLTATLEAAQYGARGVTPLARRQRRRWRAALRLLHLLRWLPAA